MNGVPIVIGLGAVLLAAGMWLMLPRAAAAGRTLGTLLVLVGLGLFGWQMPRLGHWVSDGVFLILAAITVFSAVATVTFRNPVYSAIWFALSLLGTAGLFLFQGAQFLGVATVVVYAGAILVTFLFVLMLAQPEGQAFYDRLSWGAGLAVLTGALFVGGLMWTVVKDRPEAPFSTVSLDDGILAEEHMANLGAQLFSNNLVAVEIAGTLLLVALVGTVAIIARIHKPAGDGERSHG